MRGLPPEEKALLQRIGNLMDVALNNRQASNPFEPRRNKPSRVIYPPTGLAAATGIKAVKLTWNAANSDEHLRYEIEVRNVSTGETATKSSFTHNITYYGVGGTYEAKVWSVGRNGRSPDPIKITFDIGADIMQIEGAKTGVDEHGTLIQDDILQLPGYKIFVWGSVVLDEYIAGSGNAEIAFKLWRKVGDDAEFITDSKGTLELVETITLYPATEDASNLSDSALGGQEGYTRYPPYTAHTRPGSFGTSQSVMFSPVAVAADEENKIYTYFLQAVGREVETDEVSLSITIWGGSEGAFDKIPGDPYTPRSDYVFPHYNHWHTWNTFNTDFMGNNHLWDSRWAVSQVLEGYVIPANQWTLACWWRPDAIFPAAQGDFPQTYSGTMTLFQRNSLVLESPAHDPSRNQIDWRFSTRLRGAVEWMGLHEEQGWVHQMDILVWSNLGVDFASDGQAQNMWFQVNSLVMDDDNGTSALMPWSTINSSSRQNDGWYFTVICFEGNRATDINSKPALRVWHNMGIATDPEDEHNSPDPQFHVIGMRNIQIVAENPIDYPRTPIAMSGASALSTRVLLQDDSADRIQGFGTLVQVTHAEGIYIGGSNNIAAYAVQWHQAGMWSIALDNWDGYRYVQAEGQAAMNYLYNQGFGTEIDWGGVSVIDPQPDGSEFQAYVTAENLNSLWQFGAVETAFYLGEALRDTGYHLYGGELNMTSQIFPHHEGSETDTPLGTLPYTSDSWGNTAGIWDVRSPEGTNGTTQSDICYPGQNL
jgi:hypothetical protein